ncbi:serine/threonine-protein kinase PBL27-like [Macadamia integrifolia]|uniref:serine/threonine-protein kinase PBL27-like n=1 Tax=Macadamia integrifolia TaxID=60698 RepID=UPI001C4E3AB5|nr:serine/threonine-protein kinase PBL27-like [Macadamia integrifolia]
MDIKSSNVILDSNFNAKLGDFGLARLVDNERGSQTTNVAGAMGGRLVEGEKGTQTTNVAGTKGYMAHEYVITGKASKESDVYSFGIVLLEISCGRKAVERTVNPSEKSLVQWVWELYGRGKQLEAADPSDAMDLDKQQIGCMIVVGLWCSQQDSDLRPSIGQAINVLKFDAPLPILPYRRVLVSSPFNMNKFSITSTHGSSECNTSNKQRSSGSNATDFCVLNKSSPSSSPSAYLLMSSRKGKETTSSSKRRKTTTSRARNATLGSSSSWARPVRNPPVDPIDFDGSLFHNTEAAVAWSIFSTRSIMMEKTIVTDDFSAYHMLERFTTLGWQSILHPDSPCHEDFVWYFYCNLEVSFRDGEYSLTSLVKGVDIILMVDLLAAILGISAEGAHFYNPPRIKAVGMGLSIKMQESIFET